jgi:uncharacterized membrane protein YoaK (UPF0700 family)
MKWKDYKKETLKWLPVFGLFMCGAIGNQVAQMLFKADHFWWALFAWVMFYFAAIKFYELTKECSY